MAAADVDLLSADDNDALALEELLGNGGRETTKEVAPGVNDDPLQTKNHKNHCDAPIIRNKNRETRSKRSDKPTPNEEQKGRAESHRGNVNEPSQDP